MGQALDRDGYVLGEAFGETKCEDFDKLIAEHPAAAEIRIKTLQQRVEAAEREEPQLDHEYNPPRLAPTRITLDNIELAFTYKSWDQSQVARGSAVTRALIEAGKVILRNVPECPLRTRALNDLIDARMKANAASTHDGRF